MLYEKINNLGPTEHMEIFKILNDEGIPYTENTNGVFFNLTTLASDTFFKIGEFVEYCCDNKKELDEYDQKLQECKYNNAKSHVALACGVREPMPKHECIKEMFESIDKDNTIQDFIQKLSSVQDKVVSKRVNSKFSISRKRFMKRTTDLYDVFADDLERDSYSI